MTSPQPTGAIDRSLFADFEAAALDLIQPPGADAARRAAARRREVRTAIVSATVAAMVTGAVVGVLANGWPGEELPTSGPAVTESTQFDQASGPAMQGGPSLPAPNQSPSGGPTQSRGASPSIDLSIRGPSSVTLRPANGRYEGQFTITVSNTGPTPTSGLSYRVKMPPGVRVNAPATTAFAMCMPNSLDPSSQEYGCVWPGEPVPVGGSLTVVVALIADYAPGNDRTITGFTLNIGGPFGPQPQQTDRTPANNILEPTIVLSGD